MDANLDRFAFGIKDKQEDSVVHICSVSGNEIYEGESFLDYDGEIMKEDIEVLIERFQILRRFADYEGVEE